MVISLFVHVYLVFIYFCFMKPAQRSVSLIKHRFLRKDISILEMTPLQIKKINSEHLVFVHVSTMVVTI